MDVERMVVAGSHERVLAVGFGEPSVTVADQQRRALNLVDWLRRTTDTVAIVGGGVAGVTLMAAASMAGVDCTLFEQAPRTLQLFEQNTTRLIHPHFYDWPRDGWRREQNCVPVLDWHAGSGRQVVDQLSRGFDAVCTAYELHDRVRLNERVVRLVPGEGGVQLQVDGRAAERFGRVVLCVGFGLEANLDEFGTTSYWDDHTIGRFKPDGEPTPFLISGCGDGGMIDYLRARIQSSRMSEVSGIHAVDQLELANLVDDAFPEMDALKQGLLDIESQAWAVFEQTHDDAIDMGRPPGEAANEADAASGVFLTAAYARLAKDEPTRYAVAAVDRAIEKRGLRPETKGTRLNQDKPGPLRLSAFILNRFLCFRVLVADGMQVEDGVITQPGPFLKGRLSREDASEGGRLRVGKHRFEPRLALVRHGPRRGARFAELVGETPVRVGRDPNVEPDWERASDQDDAARWSLHLGLMECVGGTTLDVARCLILHMRQPRHVPEDSWRGREEAIQEAQDDAANVLAELSHDIGPSEARALVSLARELWSRLGSASLVSIVLARALDHAMGETGELQRVFARLNAGPQSAGDCKVVATVRPVDDQTQPGMRWVRLVRLPAQVSLRVSPQPGRLSKLKHVAALIPTALPADWSPPTGGPGLLVAPGEPEAGGGLADWASTNDGFAVTGSARQIHSYCGSASHCHADLGEPRGSASGREVVLHWDRLGRTVCALPADHLQDALVRQVVVELAPCLAATVACRATVASVRACGEALVEFGGQLAASLADAETEFVTSPSNGGGPTTIATHHWRIRTLDNT